MKIFCKNRDEARSLKKGSSKNLKIVKLEKPSLNGHNWAVVLDNSKQEKFS